MRWSQINDFILLDYSVCLLAKKNTFCEISFWDFGIIKNLNKRKYWEGGANHTKTNKLFGRLSLDKYNLKKWEQKNLWKIVNRVCKILR